MDKQEVIKRYKSGEKVSKIAKDNFVSREAVYKVLRKMGRFKKTSEKLREKRKKETKNKYLKHTEDIIKLLEDGLSMTQIAEALEIPRKYVSEALRGSQFDYSQEYILERNEKIFKLYSKGLRQRQLADMFDTTQPNISNIIHRHFEDKLEDKLENNKTT